MREITEAGLPTNPETISRPLARNDSTLKSPPRFEELDALRGIAAASVVMNHFHEMWLTPAETSKLSAAENFVLNRSHILWAGHEAVILFFLLSGFVLSQPFLDGRAQPPLQFALRRIIRIYGPYLIALLIAVCCAFYWHGNLDRGSWAAQQWTRTPQASLVIKHILFLGSYNTAEFDSPIWTLVHELRISLVFPFIFMLSEAMGPKISLIFAATMSAIAIFSLENAGYHSTAMTIHCSSFFIVGILIARHSRSIRIIYMASTKPVKLLFASVGLLLYAQTAVFAPRILKHSIEGLKAIMLMDWLIMLGAAAFIILAVNSARAKRILKAPTLISLGSISFSLYLIHMIVLLAVTHLCLRNISPWIQLPIYLLCSLLLAMAFHRAVDQPFVKLSRAISR